MNRLCILLGMSVLGWIGWWIGDHVGLMTGFVLGSIGSVAGVYVGWRVNRDYLS